MFRRKKTTADDPAPGKKVSKPQDVAALVRRHSAVFSVAVNRLEDELAKIRNLPDAGERYLELERFHAKVKPMKHAAVDRMAGGISRKLEYLQNALMSPIAVVGLALYLLGPAIYGGLVEMNGERCLKERRRIVTEAAEKIEFFKAHDELLEKIQPLKNELLDHRRTAIEASTHFSGLCKEFPAAREAFLYAAAQPAEKPADIPPPASAAPGSKGRLTL